MGSPLSPLNLRTISRGSSTGNSVDNRPWSRQSRPMTQETISRTVSRGSSVENLLRPLSRQLTSRQGSFRGSRPSTQGSSEMRPDTPETDDDLSDTGHSESRRWRKMWPKIVQTNDAAILKAKAMAKNLGTIGKDLSEVQSSLWKNKANRNMLGFTENTGGIGVKGGGGRTFMTSSMNQNNVVVRKVFVDLDALNRPMSADISGSGLEVPLVSFKREGGFSMDSKRQRHHHQRYSPKNSSHTSGGVLFDANQGEMKMGDKQHGNHHAHHSIDKAEGSFQDIKSTRADLKKAHLEAILKMERQRIQEEEDEEKELEDFF